MEDNVMKNKAWLAIVFFTMLVPNIYASEESASPDERQNARGAMTFFYSGYAYPKSSATIGFLPAHQGGIEFSRYRNRNIGVSSEISLIYAPNRSNPRLVSSALMLDYAMMFTIRAPLSASFAFTIGAGWFMGTPVGVQDAMTGEFSWGTREMRREVGLFKTGPALKVGLELGGNAANSFFVPVGMVARYQFYDGFKIGGYVGIGYRF
jgi:hypothetical protein